MICLICRKESRNEQAVEDRAGRGCGLADSCRARGRRVRAVLRCQRFSWPDHRAGQEGDRPRARDRRYSPEFLPDARRPRARHEAQQCSRFRRRAVRGHRRGQCRRAAAAADSAPRGQGRHGHTDRPATQRRKERRWQKQLGRSGERRRQTGHSGAARAGRRQRHQVHRHRGRQHQGRRDQLYRRSGEDFLRADQAQSQDWLDPPRQAFRLRAGFRDGSRAARSRRERQPRCEARARSRKAVVRRRQDRAQGQGDDAGDEGRHRARRQCQRRSGEQGLQDGEADREGRRRREVPAGRHAEDRLQRRRDLRRRQGHAEIRWRRAGGGRTDRLDRARWHRPQRRNAALHRPAQHQDLQPARASENLWHETRNRRCRRAQGDEHPGQARCDDEERAAQRPDHQARPEHDHRQRRHRRSGNAGRRVRTEARYDRR